MSKKNREQLISWVIVIILGVIFFAMWISQFPRYQD